VLDVDAAGVRLEIGDDGQGFDAVALADDPRRGIGLRNMRERLDAIGGELTVRTRPGDGTRIIAAVPLGHLHLTDSA